MRVSKEIRDLAEQRRRERFSLWVDGMRLRASMQSLELPRISEDEWNHYEGGHRA